MYAKSFLPEETFYDTIAEKYDDEYHYNLALAENQFITDLIKKENIHEGNVLDLGCGTGLFLDYIPKDKSQYYGIDISSNMLNKMKEKHPGANAVKMNITDIVKNFRMNSFDSVISLFGSLAYIEDTGEAIDGIYNLLKPGGKFFLMVPTEKYITRRNFIGNKFNSDIKLSTYTSDCAKKYFSKFSQTKIKGFNLFAEFLPEKLTVNFCKSYLKFEQTILGRLFPYRHYYLLISGIK